MGSHSTTLPALPKLTLSKLQVGPMGTPWNLEIFLFRGAAAINRRKADAAVRERTLEFLNDRLPVMVAIHEEVEYRVSQGRAIASLHSTLTPLKRFIAWADSAGKSLTRDSLHNDFIEWGRHLKDLVRLGKIESDSAYQLASRVAGLVSKVTTSDGSSVDMTGFMNPTGLDGYQRQQGKSSDKQNLEDTQIFGRFLVKVSEALTVDAIFGTLPVRVSLWDEKELVVLGGLRTADKMADSWNTKRARAAVPHDAVKRRDSLSHAGRMALINLRIEAEYLIFIAQTGMNGAQAIKLSSEDKYRFRSVGDDTEYFREYKGRRGGEVVFRVFKEYRDRLEQYRTWLAELKQCGLDDRGLLFPWLTKETRFDPAGQVLSRECAAIRKYCKTLQIRHIAPAVLRKTRQNWLLRKINDPEIVAMMGAHSEETLLTIYEQPHHQTALSEISNYHAAYESKLKSPGPGPCVNEEHRPAIHPTAPASAPEPDCISPEGCLFCQHHRDVESADYVWQLTSHRELKQREIDRYARSGRDQNKLHPAQATVNKLSEKLQLFMKRSDKCAEWVNRAEDDMRSGIHHPRWAGFIELEETMA